MEFPSGQAGFRNLSLNKGVTSNKGSGFQNFHKITDLILNILKTLTKYNLVNI